MKNKKTMNKKEYTVFTVVAIAVFVLAFALLAAAGIVQNGYELSCGRIISEFFASLESIKTAKKVLEHT